MIHRTEQFYRGVVERLETPPPRRVECHRQVWSTAQGVVDETGQDSPRADLYEDGSPLDGTPALGIGRDVVLDRVIVDKNARIGDGCRLVNEKNVENADGNGYYIRGGIIVVPKGGVIPAGTVV